MIKRKRRVSDLPLQKRIDLAMEATFEKVVEEHQRVGIPLVVVRNGKVVRVPADRMVDGKKRRRATRRKRLKS